MQQYINPFDLLGMYPSQIQDANYAAIRRYKKILFADIELSDTKSVCLSNIELTLSDCIRIIDELDNDVKKEFHLIIQKNRRLKKFLTTGDTDFFHYYQSESIYTATTFIAFLSPFFAYQYSKVFCEVFKQKKVGHLKALLIPKWPFDEKTLDDCYKKTFIELLNIESEVKSTKDSLIANWSDLTEIRVHHIIELIVQRVNYSSLNTLPSYFQNGRNKIAAALTQLTCLINQLPMNYYKPAFKVITIAYSIQLTGREKQKCSLEYYSLKRKQQYFHKETTSETTTTYVENRGYESDCQSDQMGSLFTNFFSSLNHNFWYAWLLVIGIAVNYDTKEKKQPYLDSRLENMVKYQNKTYTTYSKVKDANSIKKNKGRKKKKPY